MAKKIRPAGQILLDLEKLYDELYDDHEFQLGDVLYNAYGHAKIHRPDVIEEYVDDGSNPDFKYGPKDD